MNSFLSDVLEGETIEDEICKGNARRTYVQYCACDCRLVYLTEKNNQMKKYNSLLVLAVIMLMMSCAPAMDVSPIAETEPFGFWGGLLHGIIAPFAFFVSLFDDEVAIYAVNNLGGWYDLGFVLGAGILFGGGGKGSSRSKN
jgi:hypothetical protein